MNVKINETFSIKRIFCGHVMLKKSISNSISGVVLYCLFAIFFSVGYFLGVSQSSGWCSESLCQQKVSDTVKRLEVSKYSSPLLVIIFSAPANDKRRDIIRKTWLLTKGENTIVHFFVMGTASLDSETKNDLQSENQLNNDLMLLSTVSDSYSKLSKKLLEAFKWVDKHANFTYLLKVDDDSFVRLRSLYDLLKNQPQKRFYWGFFDGRAQVKTKGKWTEENWVLCDTYLPYAKGGGYILTDDLVHYLSQNSNFLSLYKNEDVSLGTWLSPLEIKRLHDPNFDTEFRSRGCFNSYLVTHKQSEAMMVNKYQSLITLGKMCPSEHRNRFSYIYNWKAPPSLCCVRNDSKIP